MTLKETSPGWVWISNGTDEESMEKNRVKRRKRRRWLGYVAFLAVVLTTAAVLCLAMFFCTQEIVVSGNERYTADEIISASGIQL